jgi:hypothetical protein
MIKWNLMIRDTYFKNETSKKKSNDAKRKMGRLF